MGTDLPKEGGTRQQQGGVSLEGVLRIRARLAAAAQQVYNDWEQDDDDELNGGGICDLVAGAMAEVLEQSGCSTGLVSAQVGEQHVFVVARTADGVYEVDIPYYLYERGGGYQWTKLPGVSFEESDIVIRRLSNDPRDFADYVDVECVEDAEMAPTQDVRSS